MERIWKRGSISLGGRKFTFWVMLVTMDWTEYLLQAVEEPARHQGFYLPRRFPRRREPRICMTQGPQK